MAPEFFHGRPVDLLRIANRHIDRRRVAALAVAPDKMPRYIRRAELINRICEQGIRLLREHEIQGALTVTAREATYIFKMKARAYFERVKPVRSLFG